MENKEYKELVQELVNEFKKTLPENETVMTEKFEEYLYILINKWQNETSKFLIRSREEIETDLRSITKRLSGYELEQKEEILIEDDKFRQIVISSNYIYGMAKEVLNGNKQSIDSDDMKNKIETMLNLSEEVKSYNKEKAKRLVSESILDFNFINNPNNELLSIRLADEKRNMQEKKNLASKKIEEEEER